MEVRNLNFLNLDTLYQIVVEKFYDQNYNNVKFGRNLSQLLNHIAITFELANVSEYEYIYLKMYSDNITPLTKRQYDTEHIYKNYPDVADNAIKLFSLFSTVQEERTRTNVKYTMDSYLTPSGMIVGECIVTLSGSHLAQMITLDPRDFFIKASENKCVIVNDDPSKNKLDPAYKDKLYDDESLINYVIAEFLSGFYKFLVEKATHIDLASDSFNIGKFLSLDNKKIVKLMNLRNPYILCEFNDDSSSNIKNILDYYKNLGKSKEYTLKNTYFEIMIRSEFGVFTELMNLLPYEKFICLENLNIPAVDTLDVKNIPECPEEWRANYENRYNGRMSNLITVINDKMNNTHNTVKRLEMTENYILYSYSLLLSLDDIDKYLSSYITDNNETSDYRVNETVSVIKQIIRYAGGIYRNM